MSRGFAFLLGCALFAQPVSAEMREVSLGRYDCQASAGRYHRQDVSNFFGGDSTASRIRFLSEDPNPKWDTLAGMIFTFDNGQTAQVLVIAPPDDPRILWIGLRPLGNPEVTLMTSFRRGRIIELSTSIARGAIFVRVGNDRGQIRLDDARLVRREIICTGGHFEIELTRNPRPARRY